MIQVEAARTNGMLRLRVSDNGVGMAKGADGSLGYRLVRALTSQVGGTIGVDSNDGGTTVTVTTAA